MNYENSNIDVQEYLKRFDKITNQMCYKMRTSPRCSNISLNFINEMIPHHEGAIQMCNNLLKYNIDPKLERVAKNIINEQSRGVEELKSIRNSLCSNRF